MKLFSTHELKICKLFGKEGKVVFPTISQLDSIIRNGGTHVVAHVASSGLAVKSGNVREDISTLEDKT
jgi:hypothetical protein